MSVSALINTPSFVSFKHPAYSEEYNQNLFLQLYAWDSDRKSGNATSTKGLHFRTSFLACALIACDAWDGYISSDREGRAKIVPSTPDDILPAGTYYFHVPDPNPDPSPSAEPYRYPVYPSFDHWKFPHGQMHRVGDGDFPKTTNDTIPERSSLLGSTTSESATSAAVITRDEGCASL